MHNLFSKRVTIELLQVCNIALAHNRNGIAICTELPISPISFYTVYGPNHNDRVSLPNVCVGKGVYLASAPGVLILKDKKHYTVGEHSINEYLYQLKSRDGYCAILIYVKGKNHIDVLNDCLQNLNYITPLNKLIFDNDECLYLFNDTISTLDNLKSALDL